MRALALVAFIALSVASPRAQAEDLFVGGAGDPYTSIGDALGDAGDGDVVIVRAGTYEESLETSSAGVTLRGEGEVVITTGGRVLRVLHARFTLEDVILDGQYGSSDAVVLDDGADDATLRRVEIRRAGRDCVDIRAPERVTIESSLVHHCLWSLSAGCDAADCRDDAHGIVLSQARDVRIVDTEIHTFSGDAVQANGRDTTDPVWTDLHIEGCTFWLLPLETAQGGFAAGVVPGENALDTKTSDTVETPARVTIVDTVARGFGGGLISNMAAYNLKENVEVVLDGVTVHDSEIAFRLRGATSSRPRGAVVTVYDGVLHDVSTAVRYEDDIDVVTLWNVTFGGDIDRAFDDQSDAGTIDARNLLVLGDALPAEVDGVASNLAVDASAFVDAEGDDYRLAEGSPAVDAGETLDGPGADRDGIARPVGAAWDVGAHERCAGDECGPVDPDGGTGRRDGGAAVDAGGSGSRDGGGPGGDGGGVAPSDDGGCGCRMTRRGGAPEGAALLLLGLLAFARRGRRRPR